MKILLSKLIDFILISVIVVPACFSVYLLVSEYAAYILATAILIPFAVLKAFIAPFHKPRKRRCDKKRYLNAVGDLDPSASFAYSYD